MNKQETDWVARMENGRKYLNAGNYQAAEKIFKQLANETEDPIARNNYALARYLQEDWGQTLEILGPNLQTEVLNPYARALAAKSYQQLGRNELAEKMLNQAVIQFEWGASKAVAEWFDYLGIIAETAGLLLKHRLVVDLHQKWSHRYVNPENFIYAGTAYFNLGRYKQAVGVWNKVVRQHQYLDYFVGMAQKIEAGFIPAFALEYGLISLPEPLEMQWIEDNIARGQVKMFILGFIFDKKPGKKKAIDGMLHSLIKNNGEWGEKLAREILRSNSWDMSFKTEAGRALQELGIFKPDEPFPMRIDGKEQLVKIEKLEVASQNDQYDHAVKQALQFIRTKEYDKAEELAKSILEQGFFYPPAMQILVRVNFLKGKYSEAANLLTSLLVMNPENPSLLLMMVDIQLHMGDLEKAREYLNFVEPQDHPDELRGSYIALLQALTKSELLNLQTAYHEQLWQETLEKPLPLKATLHACLKRIPADWLTAICINLGLKPEPKRQNREMQIVKSFEDPATVGRVIRDLPENAKSLLRLIIKKHGRIRLGEITRRFGSVIADKYCWTEEMPATPLGQLLSHGLAFVGTVPGENGRRYKTIVLPDDRLVQLQCEMGKVGK